MYTEIPRHGGARPGAGRPRKDEDGDTVTSDYNYWKAKSEEFKARQAELEYLAKVGEYVPRAAVQQASATAMNTFVQHARSIADNLERSLGLKPEVAAAIAESIDQAMGALAEDLKGLADAGKAVKA